MTVLATGSVATRERGRRTRRWVPGLIAVIAALLIWEVAVRLGLLNPLYFPTMIETVGTLVALLGQQFFWVALGNTLIGAASGLAIAVAWAVPLGSVVGSSRWFFRAFRVPIEFLRPMPAVALIPVAVLILGTGMNSKIFLAAFAAFWPILIHTIYGMHDTDSVVVETARSFRIRRLDRVLRIKLPAAFPFIFTGLRIAASISLILAITAEILLGSPGLGREINIARSGGAIVLMYALILATGVLGLALNTIMVRIEVRVLRWHASQREAQL